MITWTHQGAHDAKQGATAHEGCRVDVRARGRQAARGDAGSGQAKSPSGQARREVGRWGLGLLLTFVLMSVSGTRAFGAHLTPPADLACSLTQLTHASSGFSLNPSINAAGTRIAFHSNADLTGDNADRSAEIFLVDTTTGSFTQLTHSPNDFVNLSVFPSINAAGTRIAFWSSADLTGDNADRNAEIFLVDTTTGSLTQLTHSPSGFSSEPSINAVGTRIAFVSQADLTGGNADGNSELFLATCVEVVNDLVTFTPLPTTYQTTADPAGCPAGFVGQFRFAARLTATPSSPALADLRVQVHTVTNGNLLQNADSGPGGVGATVTLPQTDALADGLLSPEEAVDVPFVVCLQERSPFSFFVDVLGRVSDDGE